MWKEGGHLPEASSFLHLHYSMNAHNYVWSYNVKISEQEVTLDDFRPNLISEKETESQRCLK